MCGGSVRSGGVILGSLASGCVRGNSAGVDSRLDQAIRRRWATGSPASPELPRRRVPHGEPVASCAVEGIRTHSVLPQNPLIPVPQTVQHSLHQPLLPTRDHLVQRGCDEARQADHVGVVLHRGVQDLLPGHHNPQVDDLAGGGDGVVGCCEDIRLRVVQAMTIPSAFLRGRQVRHACPRRAP